MKLRALNTSALGVVGSALMLFAGFAQTSCKSGDSSKPAPSASAAASAREQLVSHPPEASIKAPADVAKPPANAEKTPSGLASKVLKKGTGTAKPTLYDRVKVHYTGWTTDGRMFDSSVKRGRPATFGLRQVIPGWTEGIPLMTVGEKRRFWIPAKLAYGERTMGGRPAGALTFDVELLEIIEGPKPPETPKNVKAPPATAKKTKSGLAYTVLEKGEGKKHPDAASRVQVHYTGWTTDGQLFDSSLVRGRPATFNLNQVIKGWTEGVQLMVEGEKTRFWIPAKLAYGDKPKRPGAPSGMLVFDIELLKIF